jgi:hypothetical protein
MDCEHPAWNPGVTPWLSTCAECGALSKDVFREDIIAALGPGIIEELDAPYEPMPAPPASWYDGQVRVFRTADEGTPVEPMVAPKATRTLRRIEKQQRGLGRIREYLRIAPPRRTRSNTGPAGRSTRRTRSRTSTARGPDGEPDPPPGEPQPEDGFTPSGPVERVWQLALSELDSIADYLELAALAVSRAEWLSALRRWWR